MPATRLHAGLTAARTLFLPCKTFGLAKRR
jgi:hypothetical protein